MQYNTSNVIIVKAAVPDGKPLRLFSSAEATSTASANAHPCGLSMFSIATDSIAPDVLRKRISSIVGLVCIPHQPIVDAIDCDVPDGHVKRVLLTKIIEAVGIPVKSVSL